MTEKIPEITVTRELHGGSWFVEADGTPVGPPLADRPAAEVVARWLSANLAWVRAIEVPPWDADSRWDRFWGHASTAAEKEDRP